VIKIGVAATVAECDDLVAAASGFGRVVAVGHTFLFSPAVRRMRELIEGGCAGRLPYAHAVRTRLGPQFLHCCSTGERPLVDGVAAPRVVAVFEAATQSLRSGGGPVQVSAPAAAQ
jgi:hypothetical protein